MLTGDDVLKKVRGVSRTELTVWVERGWVSPVRDDGGVFYREIDVARVRFIHELKAELAIDEEILPTVLSLVDQVYGLRCELRVLTEALRAERSDVRARILEAVERLRTLE